MATSRQVISAGPETAAPVDLSRVALAVLTLNEERGLPAVLFAAARLGVTTFVVDGGSTDHTRGVARAFGVPVVEAQPGKGRAWRRFLASGLAGDREYVAMVDGDATYNLLALPQLLATGADMAIAWRRARPGAMTLTRAAGNFAMSTLAGWIAGTTCPDLLSGFRVMRREALDRIAFKSEGFELETELTTEFLRLGLRVAWVPVAYERRLGTSKLSPVKDGAAILRALLRARRR